MDNNYKYVLEDGNIYYVHGGMKQSKSYADISIMYDADDDVLLKHGPSEGVNKYFSEFIEKLRRGKTEENSEVIDEMVEASRVITISKDTILEKPSILEDINKSISDSGYITKFAESFS